MKSIFTKTLIAAAIAGVASANAATIDSVDSGSATGIQQVISAQGLSVAGEIVVGNVDGTSTTQLQIEITPANDNYDSGDFLEITFGGAAVSDDTTVTDVELQTSTGTVVASGFSLDDDGTLVLSVIDSQLAVMNGLNALYLTGVTLDSIGGAGSTISVDYTAVRNDRNFDNTDETVVAQVGSEFTLTGPTADTQLDATIDVENDRESFVDDVTSDDDFYNGNGDAGSDDTDTFSLTAANSADLLPITITGATHTVTSSVSGFGYLTDADGDLNTGAVVATAGSAAMTADVTDAGTLTVAFAGSSVSGSTAVTHSISLTVDGDELAPQTFTAKTAIDWNLAGETDSTFTSDSYAAGAWELSGATHLVEFMPYGSGISQFIYVTNSSDVDGDVEVSAIQDDGTTYNGGTISVSAAANSVTKVSDQVTAALAEAGANTSSGRLAITLVINAPKADIDVTAGYNSRGDRVLID